jgi:DNA-binding CsgD family transcriptional regulator
MGPSAVALDRCRTLLDRLGSAQLSLEEYAGTALPALRRAAGFDGWCLQLTDPDSRLPMTVAHNDAPLGDRLAQFWWFEFHGSGGAEPGRTARATVLAATTRRDVAGARRYTELLRPGGVADELRCSLVTDRMRWGSVALFRSQAAQRFTDADAAAVTPLLETLAAGARHAWAASAPVRDASAAAEPGTLLYGRDGTLISQTPAAGHWLGQLDGSYSMISAMLTMLETTPAASLRTRTVTGIWLRISGGRLIPEAGTATVAITIQEATPTEITPLLLRAYALTPRQRAVARLVLAGQSGPQIAAALHLSQHTVNDHLKAIADKTRVRSRGHLTAVLTGAPLAAPGDHHRHGTTSCA